MNNKPKTIFKKIAACEDVEVKEHYIQKYVRILKKSKHIDIMSMINIVSSDNDISALLLQQYSLTFMKRSKNTTL